MASGDGIQQSRELGRVSSRLLSFPMVIGYALMLAKASTRTVSNRATPATKSRLTPLMTAGVDILILRACAVLVLSPTDFSMLRGRLDPRINTMLLSRLAPTEVGGYALRAIFLMVRRFLFGTETLILSRIITRPNVGVVTILDLVSDHGALFHYIC